MLVLRIVGYLGNHHWTSYLKCKLLGLILGFLIQEVRGFMKNPPGCCLGSPHSYYRSTTPSLEHHSDLSPNERPIREPRQLTLPPPMHFAAFPALVSKPQSPMVTVLTTPPPAPSAHNHQAALSPLSLPHPDCFPSVNAWSPRLLKA